MEDGASECTEGLLFILESVPSCAIVIRVKQRHVPTTTECGLRRLSQIPTTTKGDPSRDSKTPDTGCLTQECAHLKGCVCFQCPFRPKERRGRTEKKVWPTLVFASAVDSLVTTAVTAPTHPRSRAVQGASATRAARRAT